MSDREYDIDDWRLRVGSFILSFGDVELVTLKLWEDEFGDAPPPNQFRDRTRKLLGKLRERTDTEQLTQLLIQANRLAEKRNLIAHNPLMVQVYEHTRTGELLTSMAISRRTTDEFIDDAELLELVSEAEDLAADLYIASGWEWPGA